MADKRLGRRKQALGAVNLNLLSDGFAGKCIDKAIASIVQDIEQRGDDNKDRKLVITYTFTPSKDSRVEIDTQIQTKVPALRPYKTVAKLGKGSGELEFDPDSGENPDQLTIGSSDAE